MARKKTVEPSEIVLVPLNIRGFNATDKNKELISLLMESDPKVRCFNETMLKYQLNLDGYWSQQSISKRNGGCWILTKKSAFNTLTALGTYLNRSRLTTMKGDIHLLNWHLENG